MNEELGIMNGGTCYPFLKRGYPSIIRHSSFVIPRFHKGFTLVEMLIVVAILAVLMTIVFRLGGGVQDTCRTKTVVRMQKLENCLSGYYAAFGSYPPVKVHGWRNISQPVDRNGDQQETGSGSMNQGEGGTSLVWAQVDAACRCQPFGCEYPPNQSKPTNSSGNQEKSEEEIIKEWAEDIKSRIGNSSEYPLYQSWGFKDAFSGDIRVPSINAGFVGVWTESDWKAIKLFKFGVMSFLLPRYLFMMGGDIGFFGGSGGNGKVCAQWGDNNDIPSDPFSGKSYDEAYSGNAWNSVRAHAQVDKSTKDINRQDLARVAHIPSQAVCARWMPNLEGLCSTLKEMEFFGIDVSEKPTGLPAGKEGSDGEIHPPDPKTHEVGGATYRNASVTVNDGWENEFYYYSPPPYQTYTLWSAGPNGKTFPPWVAIESLENATDRETAMEWRSDDIMQMSH